VTAPIYHLIPNAPKPVAPYSHVVEADGWLFVTGQLATDPDDASLPLPEGIEAQTRKVMDNLKRAHDAKRRGTGSSLTHRWGKWIRTFGPSQGMSQIGTVGAERDIGRRKRRFLYGGTDGSNPVPSSGEFVVEPLRKPAA
jgi:hypothetical protein